MRDKALQYFAAGGITILSSCIISCGVANIPTPFSSSNKTSLPSNASAGELLAQGQRYEQSNQTSKALSSYAKINKKYPLSNAAAESSYLQAKIFDDQGKLFEAFEAYQENIVRHTNCRHYSKSIIRQEQIAHYVADGHIQNNFLGLKTSISPNKTIGMLRKVRDNAPNAPSASRAQYTIGRLLQENKNYADATSAYQKMATDYSTSKEAPEALFQTSEILISKAKKGNQNKANVNRARDTYQSLIDRYPSHPRAKDARARIASLGGQAIQRNYDTAEFYRKKGKNTSAIFYYNQVIRETKNGSLHALSKQRISELGG